MFRDFVLSLEVVARWELGLTLLLALPSACTTPAPAATPEPVQVTISGSTAMAPLLTALADAFDDQHREAAIQVEVEIEIEAVNSAFGITQIEQQKADLAAVAVTPPEDVWAAPIALDAVAVIVHPENPLQELSLIQLQAVFSGRQWHWSDLAVSVPEDEITVVSREQGSGTRSVFEERAMQGTSVTPTAIVIPGSAAVVDFVADRRNAIGYVSQGYVSPGVRAIRVEGLAPDLAHIADHGYRLVRPFYLIALQEPNGPTRQFVDFCLGPGGQAIVSQGYAPVQANNR
jgi:phosphate transport system substrate-binding protein